MKNYLRSEFTRLSDLFRPSSSGPLRASLCWAVIALFVVLVPIACYAVAAFLGGNGVPSWSLVCLASFGAAFIVALFWSIVLSLRKRRLTIPRGQRGFR